MPNASEPGPETSVAQLVAGIVADAQDLIKQQFILFRHEVHADLRQLRDAGSLMASGIGLALLGVILLSLMLVHLLAWAAPSLPLFACYGLVGAPVALLGGGLCFAGARKLKTINPPLDQSVQALKENVRG